MDIDCTQYSAQAAVPFTKVWPWLMAFGLVMWLTLLSGCASIREAGNVSHIVRDDIASLPVNDSGDDNAEIAESPPARTNIAQNQPLERRREPSSASEIASDRNSTSISGSRPVFESASDTLNPSPTSHASIQGEGTQQSFGSWIANSIDPPGSPRDGGLDQSFDLFEEADDYGEGPFSRDGPGGPGDDPDGGPGGGPPPGFAGRGDEPGYSIMWYPSATVAGQGTELSMIRQSVGVDVPVWFKDEDMVMASVGVSETHFTGDVILPDTMRAFPTDLWNVQFGLKHMHQYSNGWTSMLMFDIGSASDKPFQSMRDINFQLGGFVMIPAKNQRDMWMLGAIYSPLGNPAFPIPLLSYHWKPSDTFEMSIGLPCSIKWKATDRLSFDLSYFPILSVDALVTYKFTDHVEVYGGYQNVNDSWYLHDRADRQDQFLAIEQRLIIGLRRDLTEKLSFDVNAGYAFNRYFGEGNGMGSTKSDLTDRVSLDAGAFIGGRLTWNF